MRKKFAAGFFLIALGLPCLYASAKVRPSSGYQPATVLSVQRQQVWSPNVSYTTPTDAPLQSEYYAYQVAVRVNCEKYVGRYDTPFDYLSSAFSPQKPIMVRLTRHTMYFTVGGQPEMKMGIVRHSLDRAAPCGSGAINR